MPRNVEGIIGAAPIPQPVKADVWDAYYGATDADDLARRIGGMDIPQELKADLWDEKEGESGVRFTGPPVSARGEMPAPAPPKPSPYDGTLAGKMALPQPAEAEQMAQNAATPLAGWAIQGGIAPPQAGQPPQIPMEYAPTPFGATTAFGAQPTPGSLQERFQQHLGGQAQELPYADLRGLISNYVPTGQADPRAAALAQALKGGLQGAEEFGTAMLNPTNTIMVATTFGMGAIPVITRLMAAGFSFSMIRSLAEQAPQLKKQIMAGDIQGSMRTAVNMAGTGYFAYESGKGAAEPAAKAATAKIQEIRKRQAATREAEAKGTTTTGLRPGEKPPAPAAQTAAAPAQPAQKAAETPAAQPQKAAETPKPRKQELTDEALVEMLKTEPPGLKRRGLEAVARYKGIPIPEIKSRAEQAGEALSNLAHYHDLFDQADERMAALEKQRAAKRPKGERPTVPEEGIPEQVSRVVEGRNRLAQKFFGTPFSDIEKNSDRNAIDSLILEGQGMSVEPSEGGEKIPEKKGFLQALDEAGKASSKWLRDNGLVGGSSFSSNRYLDREVMFHLARSLAGDVARGLLTAHAAAVRIAKLGKSDDDETIVAAIESQIREHIRSARMGRLMSAPPPTPKPPAYAGEITSQPKETERNAETRKQTALPAGHEQRGPAGPGEPGQLNVEPEQRVGGAARTDGEPANVGAAPAAPAAEPASAEVPGAPVAAQTAVTPETKAPEAPPATPAPTPAERVAEKKAAAAEHQRQVKLGVQRAVLADLEKSLANPDVPAKTRATLEKKIAERKAKIAELEGAQTGETGAAGAQAEAATKPKGVPENVARAIATLKDKIAYAERLRDEQTARRQGHYTDDTAERIGQATYEQTLRPDLHDDITRALATIDKFRDLARSKGLDPNEYLAEAGLPERWRETPPEAPAAPETPKTAAPAETPKEPETEEEEAPKKRGEPGWSGEVPPSQLHVDPVRFQFKQNVGQGGAGEEFREVRQWDPEKGGVIAIWRDPKDGKDYVVNGHHRYEMATRLGAKRVLVRYLDAKDAGEARMKGALINIGEGRGEVTDAAKVFRESGMTLAELEAQNVSIKGKLAHEGMGVARLAQPLYNDVMNGDLSTARGAIIGHGLDSDADQIALYDAVKQREARGKRITNAQLEEMIRLAKGAPRTVETSEQQSMFGDQEMERSLLPEKAEISEYVRKQLAGEKKLFGLVGESAAAAKLGKAGNVIQAERNLQIAEQAGRVQALYDRLSSFAGPVDDALNQAAKRLADGENANDVKREAYDRIRDSLIKESNRYAGIREGDGKGTEGLDSEGAHKVEPVRSEPEPPVEPPAREEAVNEEPPPLAASGDVGAEREAIRRDEEKARAQWSTGPAANLPSGDALEDSPLFGGPRQGSMFGEEEGRAGLEFLNFLTGGIPKFIERDVKPTLKAAADAIADTYDDWRKAFAPQLRGGADVTSLFFRKRLGELARKTDQAKAAMRLAEKTFEAEPDKEKNFDFIDRMERRRKQATPELDTIAKALRAMYDDRRRQVQALGTGKLANFYQDYFAHIWQRPERAQEVFGAGPLQGSKAFLKRRTFRTVAEGRKAGLVPKSDNPVTLTLMKIHEMDKYIMAHRWLADAADAGRAKLVPKSDDPPPGWHQIQPAIGSVYDEAPPPWAAGVRVKPNYGEPVARWYAEAGTAQLLNNYLGPRLTRFAPVRAVMGLGNVMNLFNLGASGFHLTKTSTEAVLQKGALAFGALERGRPVEAAKTLLAAPFAPFTSFLKGDKYMREWLRPGSQGAEVGAIMDHLTSGGARAGRDQMYRTEIGAGFRRAVREGNYPGALLRLPATALEIPTRLLMDEVVPRMKFGAMADLAKAEIERLGPNAGERDVLRAMAETVNSVDNTMGEVARDNLLWNRYAADLSMLLMRADQYFLGTMRQMTGAATDVVRQPYNALKGRPVDMKRLNYVASMLLFHTVAAALYQKFHTGKWPEEAKDYLSPKNGELDENGRPARTDLTTYVKDIAALARHPGRTLENKANPAITLFSRLIRNRDFNNVEIRHADDSIRQKAADTAKEAAKEFEPISAQNLVREQKRGASPERLAEQFMGLGPASSEINQTKAERMAREYAGEHVPGEPRTKEADERRDLRLQMTRALRQGKAIPKEVMDAIRARKLATRDIALARGESRETPLQAQFTRLQFGDAMKVFEAGTPDERRTLRPMLKSKADRALKAQMTPEKRLALVKEYREALAAR